MTDTVMGVEREQYFIVVPGFMPFLISIPIDLSTEEVFNSIVKMLEGINDRNDKTEK